MTKKNRRQVIKGLTFGYLSLVVSPYIIGLDSQKRRNEAMLSVGFVPHELDLDPWLTLEENIRFIGMLYGESMETINTRMVQLSRELHITTFLQKIVKDISPGIIKKGMIIRALIHNPDILILDDPSELNDSTAIPKPLHWISPRCTGSVGFPPAKHERISVPPEIDDN